MTESPYLEIEEAARYVRVSVTAFRTHVYPKLRVHKVGRRRVFHRDELDAYMTESSHTPEASKRRRRKARVLAQTDKRVADLAKDLEGVA